MARSQQTWNKKEREKSKQKKRQDKEKKKEERKANPSLAGFDNMIAYVDENGQLTSTPPDPSKKKKIVADQIETGVPRREEIEETDTLKEGVLTYFNLSKGFGFIKEIGTGNEFFVHINNLVDRIGEGDKVSFEVQQGKKGLVAVNVKLVSTSTPK
jgi:cold shock CspA family protein